jgi:hypothetical protein
MTTIEKKQSHSPRDKMGSGKGHRKTTSKIYKPKDQAATVYQPKVESNCSSTASSSNGSDGKLSPEQKQQIEVSSNNSSSFEAQNKNSSFGIDCEEFKPKANAKFQSSVFPQHQSDLTNDDSTSNTTACDTIDQDNSKMDITMNNSMMDVSIADVQEFKPKAAPMAASSLNAHSFKPFTPSVKAAAPKSALANNGLDSLELNNDFTPSTPYVHKFRTEICKNFELYGKCKYGDEVSTISTIYTTIF